MCPRGDRCLPSSWGDIPPPTDFYFPMLECATAASPWQGSGLGGLPWEGPKSDGASVEPRVCGLPAFQSSTQYDSQSASPPRLP